MQNKLRELQQSALPKNINPMFDHVNMLTIIVPGLQNVVWRTWRSIRWNTFGKILQEHGMWGTNLNSDLLRPLEKHINDWYSSMEGKPMGLASELHMPIRELEETLRAYINDSKNSGLRNAASNALNECFK